MHLKHIAQSGRLAAYLLGSTAALLFSGCPFAPPFADFSAAPTEGDAPLTVRFDVEPGEGSTEIQSFLWDFGDGAQSVDENPTHTFEEPGFYRVSLSVANANGSSTETKEAFINVRAVPDAAFSASPRTGNTPLRVQFLDESITEPFQATAWRWTFGDGEVSTEQDPIHEYVQPGAYDVSLTVTTDGGSDTETLAGFIVVGAVPSVSFEASTTSGNAPLTVEFTDTSAAGTSEISEWFWEFGDGATSDAQHPTHTYSAAGVYSVSLTARNDAGETTFTQTNFITVSQRPTAAFRGTPLTGGAPLVVSFSDESEAGSSPITAWLWDFNDGTSSQQRNPIHEFAEAGAYDISLTVTTAAGSAVLLKEGYVVALAPPEADFSASVRRGEAPLTVEFNDLSTPGASPITGRQWNFGDGTFSGEERPAHVYATPGLYSVTLRVETATGSSSKVEQDFIEVIAKPNAAFTASPTSGETPLTVNFTDTSDPGSSPITEWLWEFGDGSTSDEQHPTRVYSAAGLYTVKLTVTTEEGTSTVTRNDLIQVVQGPRADFTATPSTGSAPLSVQFRDASDTGSEAVTGRVWDFGDGTTATVEDPLHIYQQPGVYTVSLTVTTAAGPDTERKTGFITVDPAVSFTLSPASGTVPATVTFTDTTAAAPLAILGWEWDFGDGATSTVQHPVHTYTEAGSYTVTLTVTTDQGTASAAQTAGVRLRPQAAFSGDPLAGAGAPHVVQFTDETAPGNLTIRGWDWNFGDGTHSTQQNPSHTFTTPDVYGVTLTVLTDIGNSAVTRDDYIVVRPEAAFSANVTTGVGSLAVQFTDETEPGNLDVLTWAWDFGDGATSGMQHPSHTYTQPGTYTVTLTTGSTEGPDTEIKAGYITVMPNVTFMGNSVTGQPPLEVTFTDTTNTGTLTTSARMWDFGDGDPSMDEMPAHTYEAFGNYDVTLTITTEQGEAFRTRAAYVKVVPDVVATPDVTTGVGSATVMFTNTTDTGDLTEVSWLWDFGDGMTSTEVAPTHNFTAPGVYDVALTVNSAEGVTTTETVATIAIDPIVSFTAVPNGGAAPLEVQFTDTSVTGNLSISAWNWDFGDGNMGTGANPMHSYTTAGSYMASLTITTELGDFTVGTPVTVTVTLAPPISPLRTLTPDTIPDNGQAGIFFDVAARVDVLLDSVDLYLGPDATGGLVRCYMSPFGSRGYESDPAAWTLLQITHYDGRGHVTVRLPEMVLAAGERAGFYIAGNLNPDRGPGVLYQSAAPAGADAIYTDGAVQLYTNAGKGPGIADDFDGATYDGRWFVGAFHYRCISDVGTVGAATSMQSPVGSVGMAPAPVTITGDGGWALLGGSVDGEPGGAATILERFDSNGVRIWARELGALGFSAAHRIQGLDSGAVLLTGNGTEPDGGTGTPQLSCLNGDGTVRWVRLLDGIAAADVMAATQGPNDTVYLLTAAGSVPVVMLLESTGTTAWRVALPAAPGRANWGLYGDRDGGVGVYGSAAGLAADTQTWEFHLDVSGRAAGRWRAPAR